MSKTKKAAAPEVDEPKQQAEIVQQISKATYNKSGVSVEFHEAVLVEGKAKVKKKTVEDPTPPHPDLLMSLKILLPHFIKMSPLGLLFKEVDEKYIKSRKIIDIAKEDPINMFEVNGVTFSGNDGEADYSVQLIGRLVYPNGKVISMTLPGERLNAEGGYALKEQLIEDINNFIDEIDKFINEGKAHQLSLKLEPANGNDER